MKKSCKDFQIAMLASQFSDELRDHIVVCPGCWEAFMNIGLECDMSKDMLIKSKKKLLYKAQEIENPGEKIMENFHLLSSLSFSPNAKKVFLDYFARLESCKSSHSSTWQEILGQMEDFVYNSLKRKMQESKESQDTVNAEMMMTVLHELGEPEDFLKTIGKSAPAKTRRLYRSKEDKLIAGVCGGLGEYFRIDPLLFRILFVAFFFSGGWTLPLYIILWIFLPWKPEPVLSGKAKTEVPSAPGCRFPFVRKFALWLVVFFLFLVVYIPVLLGLGFVSIISAISLFSPIIGDEIFSLSLAQFGVTGLVGGSAVSLLFFSLFLLVVSFISRLHFKKNFLGKNLQAIVVVLVIMSIFSFLVCAGILINEHKVDSTICSTREYALAEGETTLKLDKSEWGKMIGGDIPVQLFAVQGQANVKQIIVSATLHARGRTINLASQNASQIHVSWPEKGKGYLPAFGKKDKTYRFESVEIALIIPENMNLELQDWSLRTHIEGIKQANLSLKKSSARLFLKNLQLKNLQLHNDKGFIEGDNIAYESFSLENHTGHISLSNLKGDTWNIKNTRGNINATDITTTLDIQTEHGMIKLKIRGYDLSRKNNIQGQHSYVSLSFLKDSVPDYKIYNNKSHINNRLKKQEKQEDSLYTIKMDKSSLHLDEWEID